MPRQVRGSADHGWKLALWDCIPGWKGWTSAYTIQSILVQLQAFLLDDDLHYDTIKATAEQAVEMATGFSCTQCGHCSSQPVPRFWTVNEICQPTHGVVHIVGRPVAAKPPPQLPTKMIPVPKLDTGSQSTSTAAPVVKPTPSIPAVPPVKPAASNGASKWQVVTRKHGAAAKPAPAAKADAMPPKPSTRFSPIAPGAKATPAAEPAPVAKAVPEVPKASSVKPVPVGAAPVMSKAAKKNARRSQKRSEPVVEGEKGKAQSAAVLEQDKTAVSAIAVNDEWQTVHTTKPVVQKAPRPAAMTSNARSTLLELEGVSSRELIARIRRNFCQADVQRLGHSTPESTTTSSLGGMGSLSRLGAGELSHILCSDALPLRSLKMLSCCCRALRGACDDGFVWRHIHMKHFPSSSLQGATSADWKHAFMLEQSNVLGSLVCFHTKLTFTEDVIGFPCMFTTNPKTKRVDYAMPCFDVMSVSAFYEEKLRTSADNDNIDTLIPLYITDEHFSRALPYIERAAVLLCPHLGDRFKPEMVLHFMPMLLSTVVVLLSDKGVTASEKAIDAYCALHRLFLALVDHYRLHDAVESTVARFIAQPAMRAKSECPSLGNFVSLISVCTSDRTSWTNALPAIMTENFNRAVLWICQKDPGLVSTLKAEHRTDADLELLRSVFASQTVSLRLWMVHAAFVGLIARPNGAGQDQVKYDYDSLYGRPSAAVKAVFQRRISQILEVPAWPEWFNLVGLKQMAPHALTAVLRKSWSNSLKLGYHKKGMDFEAVHRSGISRLLMKGESYSAPTTMQKLRLNERWRWVSAGHVQYLDASALVFDQEGKCLKKVDYSSTSWTVTTKGPVAGSKMTKVKEGVFVLEAGKPAVPVRHSGDVLDQAQSMGTHTINLDLRLMPETVRCIYITVSAFADAVLSDIRLPFVEVVDEATGTVLCEYHMEDRSRLGSSKSIIMCCIARSGPRWTVRAIGAVGQGSASDYGPLSEACRQDFQRTFS